MSGGGLVSAARAVPGRGHHGHTAAALRAVPPQLHVRGEGVAVIGQPGGQVVGGGGAGPGAGAQGRVRGLGVGGLG